MEQDRRVGRHVILVLAHWWLALPEIGGDRVTPQWGPPLRGRCTAAGTGCFASINGVSEGSTARCTAATEEAVDVSADTNTCTPGRRIGRPHKCQSLRVLGWPPSQKPRSHPAHANPGDPGAVAVNRPC